MRNLIKRLRCKQPWRPVLICGADKEVMVEKVNATFEWFECPVCHVKVIKSNPQRWPGVRS